MFPVYLLTNDSQKFNDKTLLLTNDSNSSRSGLLLNQTTNGLGNCVFYDIEYNLW